MPLQSCYESTSPQELMCDGGDSRRMLEGSIGCVGSWQATSSTSDVANYRFPNCSTNIPAEGPSALPTARPTFSNTVLPDPLWLQITNTGTLPSSINPRLLHSAPPPLATFNIPPTSSIPVHHQTIHVKQNSPLFNSHQRVPYNLLYTPQSFLDEQVVAMQERRRPMEPYNDVPASILPAAKRSNMNPKPVAVPDFQASNILASGLMVSAAANVVAEFSQSTSVTISPTSRPANENSTGIISDSEFLLEPSNLVDISCMYDTCNGTKIFQGRRAWRHHLRTHHNVPGGSSARGICLYPGCDQFRAKGKGGLIRHIISDHSHVGLQCRQCNELPFTRDDPFLRHCKRVHRDHFSGRSDKFVYSDEVPT
ncbi:hypothetical protein BDN70DRAFT_892179 [Pholiota conissans]|uniref:C2H2-type domain-containing protein n=1 Tax=Pholiota conissans TaxID=109636 RepID=A0A9P6D477_9AGAR|nr:hypothetical protein BDN70DRAFT_892179 [Pholiota conissans]